MWGGGGGVGSSMSAEEGGGYGGSCRHSGGERVSQGQGYCWPGSVPTSRMILSKSPDLPRLHFPALQYTGATVASFWDGCAMNEAMHINGKARAP